MKMRSPIKETLRAAGLLICLSAGALIAQDLEYDSGSDGSDGPFNIPSPFHSGLQGHAMAYDPVRDEIIIFGGALSDANDAPALGRMWTWDGEQFTERTPDPMPPARHGFGMVWDSARQEIILFGGRDGDVLYNDTWSWNGTAWTMKTPTNTPTARWEFGMAYDEDREEVVVFGGGIGSPVDNTTWTWNGNEWTLKEPVARPSARFQHSMGYHAGTKKILLIGGRAGSTVIDEIWEWNGVNWFKLEPEIRPTPVIGGVLVENPSDNTLILLSGSTAHRGDQVVDQVWSWNGTQWTERKKMPRPQPRFFHSAAYDSQEQKIYISGGENHDNNLNDFWSFDGDAFQAITGRGYLFDMQPRTNGIFHFTSIHIPADVEIRFHPNAANTPVVWLASENVEILGDIHLSGKDGIENPGNDTGALGGPGGFRGGPGGIRQDQAGTYGGQPGLGPGGGAPGLNRSENAGDGQYRGVYGNLSLNPLVGGSGGGGGGSAENRGGSGGGGGGGAMMIASSKDLILEGSIRSQGGLATFVNGDGGVGSGGAVLLVADRLLGSGTIDVSSEGGEGIVRLEAYERPLAVGSVTSPIIGLPEPNRAIGNLPELIVTSVAGVGIPENSTGTFSVPDVTLSTADAVEIMVTARNLPDGTPVRLRITTAGSIVTIPAAEQPALTISAGSVTFQTVLPEGTGAIQAVAEF